MKPITLILSTVSAVTDDLVPAGTYKASLVIKGMGQCFTDFSSANPNATVPVDKKTDFASSGPCIDSGDTMEFNGKTKLAAVLSNPFAEAPAPEGVLTLTQEWT